MTDRQDDGLDLGLALSLSSEALSSGLEQWIAPVIGGHFDSVWSLENPLSDQAEPLVWLSAAAALAPRAAVGTAALIAPIRHPVLLARQLATLDRLTAGRLSVGVTIGRRARDYELAGVEFTRRGRTLNETLAALRAVWSGGPFDLEALHWTIRSDGPVGMRPTSAAGPALLVGGHADAALERAAQLGDGYLAGATSGPAHALETRARMVELLERHDRDVDHFRFVSNLFVVLDDSRERAISTAAEAFTARHGGPPPYDPATVVAGGSADEIAQAVFDLTEGGYQGVNLVPVTMSLEQCHAVVEVADLVKS